MRSPLFLPALALSFLAMNVRAHDPGFSTAIVTVGSREIEAVVTYSLAEMRGTASLPDAAAFRIGESCSLSSFRESKGGDENLVYRVVAPRPADGRMNLSVPLLEHLAPGHRQHLLVRDEEKAVLLNQFLHRGQSTARISLAPLPKDPVRIHPILATAADVLAFGIALWLIFRRRSSAKPLSLRSM